MRDPLTGRQRTGIVSFVAVVPDGTMTAPRAPSTTREGFGFVTPGEEATPPPPAAAPPPTTFRHHDDAPPPPDSARLRDALAAVVLAAARARDAILAGAGRLRDSVAAGHPSPPGVAVHMALADTAATAAATAAASARSIASTTGTTLEQFAPLLSAALEGEATVRAEVAQAEQIQFDSLPHPGAIRLHDTYDAKLDAPAPVPSSSTTPLLLAGAAALLIGGGWWYYRSQRTRRTRE